jgi:hypothetical protein
LLAQAPHSGFTGKPHALDAGRGFDACVTFTM